MKNQRLIDRARWLLVFIMFATAPILQADDFTCTTNADDTITITKCIGPGGAITIPKSINGLPVTRIGDGAFFNSPDFANLILNERIKSLSIPKGVTSIGVNAFRECRRLSSINIPGWQGSGLRISHWV
jgi:hypothetical protein